MIAISLIVIGLVARARETWIVQPTPAARALALGLAEGRVVEHESFDVLAAARVRPQLIVHEGAVSPANAARLLIMKTVARAKLVHLGDPRERRQDWDAIVNPRFEPLLDGSNVIRVDGWPTPAELGTHAWPEREVPLRIRALPRPVTAVLLSAPREGFTFTSDHARKLGEIVRAHAREKRGSLFVVVEPSVTEPAARAFMTTLTGVPVFLAARGDLKAEHKIVTGADQIVVAGGSIDALAAALATDRPVYLYAPKSTVGEKFKRFSLPGLQSGRLATIGDLGKDAPAFARSTTTTHLIERVRQKLGCEGRLIDEVGRR